jgi:hypothetical protein
LQNKIENSAISELEINIYSSFTGSFDSEYLAKGNPS